MFIVIAITISSQPNNGNTCGERNRCGAARTERTVLAHPATNIPRPPRREFEIDVSNARHEDERTWDGMGWDGDGVVGIVDLIGYNPSPVVPAVLI